MAEFQITDMGAGPPPPEMVEKFGMEEVPEEGASDEEEGEVLTVEEAEQESALLAAEADVEANPA